MIGPLDPAEVARLAALPRIGRARGHRLYSLDGTRWLDCWADGGRALLGHQTRGLAVRLKNEIARGLLAPYPSRWEGRLEKALLRLFPGYSRAFVFNSFESAAKAFNLKEPPQDPLDIPETESGEIVPAALWGRPLLPEHMQAQILLPLLPLPGYSHTQAVLLREAPQVSPVPEAVSPLVLVGMLKVCASIQAVTDEWDSSYALFSSILADTWERRGPYMLFRGTEHDYNAMFNTMISRKILIAPSHLRPSVLPPQLSKREAVLLSGRGSF